VSIASHDSSGTIPGSKEKISPLTHERIPSQDKFESKERIMKQLNDFNQSQQYLQRGTRSGIQVTDQTVLNSTPLLEIHTRNVSNNSTDLVNFPTFNTNNMKKIPIPPYSKNIITSDLPSSLREYSPSKKNRNGPEWEGKYKAMSELEASMNQTASINIRRINQDSRDLRDSISSPSNQVTHLKKARILIEPEESEEMELNMA
jgi:hypothetical protein